jgi:hypothetical protein
MRVLLATLLIVIGSSACCAETWPEKQARFK